MRFSVTMALVIASTSGLPVRALGQGQPSRKALAVGINAYDKQRSAEGRGQLSPLRGAVTDAKEIAEVLRTKFAFDEVQVLTDEKATRDGIIAAIRKTLVQGTKPGDVRAFYFSGHGSQVANDKSRELDKLDETIVPFDHGTAGDIRDKELARELGQVVDAGATLTVVLDSCHSGSGLRGPPRPTTLPGTAKSADLDPRAVSDPSQPVPPELRGALVISAALDLESAFEVPTPAPRGALTYSLLQALRAEGAPDEPAGRIFLRTQQRMKALTAQTPVLAGTDQRQRATLFDARRATVGTGEEIPVRWSAGQDRLAVEAFGLGAGTVLERATKAPDVEILLTEIEGPMKAYARVVKGERTAVHDGDLFRVKWLTAAGTNLVVHVPEGVTDEVLQERIADLQALRRTGGVEWVDDPEQEGSATHGLAWEATKDGPRWMLFSAGAKGAAMRALTPKELRAWKPGPGPKPRLFATLPPTAALAKSLRERWSAPAGLVAVTASRPDAHYRLVGRIGEAFVSADGKRTEAAEYAWSRAPKLDGGPASALSTRTDFARVAYGPDGAEDSAATLQISAEDLSRGYAWFMLNSSKENDDKFPFRLALRREDGELRRAGQEVVAGEVYGLVLEPTEPGKAALEQRNVYVFVMDSWGGRTLLFPPASSGDVENFLPVKGKEGEPIVLKERLFRVAKPFGNDTYFLFASEKKLPRYSKVLQASAVRTRGSGEKGADDFALPLQLLAPAIGERSAELLEPPPPATHWTVRRLPIMSVDKVK